MSGRFFNSVRPANESSLAPDPLSKESVIQKTTILLVEDDLTVRQALTNALAFENFGVVEAATSDEALRGLAANSIDVVLLDLDLGVENGGDTFEQLKKIQPTLPAVLMSARADHRAAFSAHGVNAVMEKPLDLPLLFRVLSTLATRAHGTGSRGACACPA
ncbi:MAG: response regulator [Verrucomicrobia bacterium]|nr:MAG: response regulator [Verrucomicrobiota bacterium]